MLHVHACGVIFSTLAALCWGMALVMSKGILTSLSPLLLLLIQLTSSVLFVWSVIFITKAKLHDLDKIKIVSLLGLLEPFLTYILVLFGLTYVSASNAALLQSLESMFIVVLAAWFFKERISKLFILLSFVILIGLYFSINGSLLGVIDNDTLGLFFIISGMFIAALYVVFTSRVISTANPMVVVACQQSLALLATGGVFAIQCVFMGCIFQPVTPGVIVLAIISGIFQYGLAFIFYLIALKNISAGLAGMFLNLVPVFGIVGAWLFLGEEMRMIQIIGAIATICALLVMSAVSNRNN